MPISLKYAVVERERRPRSLLPGDVLSKRRHLIERDGVRVAVDEHPDGTLIAEIDDGEDAPGVVPDWLDVLEDVSDAERWTGAGLARSGGS